MDGHFVALLDVLGFSALVTADATGDRVRGYLGCLERATKESDVEYVVFSDSIVLTAEGDGPDSLLAVARTCSRLLGDLLNEGIPLRGAIAFGSLVRSAIAKSVFVAGRAVIEAYQFEQAQNWVGIMVAPSALSHVPDLRSRCYRSNLTDDKSFKEALPRLPWAAFIQPCHRIPFHTSTPQERSSFDGFAIVPTNGELEPASLRDSIFVAMKRLEWLRAIAPSPRAQEKHQEAINWLSDIATHWHNVAAIQEQVQKAAALKLQPQQE